MLIERGRGHGIGHQIRETSAIGGHFNLVPCDQRAAMALGGRPPQVDDRMPARSGRQRLGRCERRYGSCNAGTRDLGPTALSLRIDRAYKIMIGGVHHKVSMRKTLNRRSNAGLGIPY